MIILFVDDDEVLRRAMKIVLCAAGYDFMEAASGTQALEIFKTTRPDLVVLDVMMPGLSGFETCEEIRNLSRTTPILFLSAKAEIEDKRTGFGLGADDYLAKPFESEELLMRIAALLRRGHIKGNIAHLETLEIERITISFRRHELLLNGEKIALTPKEFRIIEVLAEHAGDVIERNELVRSVWGNEYTDDMVGIATYIRHIREKIEKDPSKPQYLKTVWGVGYLLAVS